MTALVDNFYSEVEMMGDKRWDTSGLLARLQLQISRKNWICHAARFSRQRLIQIQREKVMAAKPQRDRHAEVRHNVQLLARGARQME